MFKFMFILYEHRSENKEKKLRKVRIGMEMKMSDVRHWQRLYSDIPLMFDSILFSPISEELISGSH
jgi:hypothetical protein